MPRSNQGGGPWGSGGSTPPDLEEFLRRSQDRLRTVLPGGSFGGKGIVLAALAEHPARSCPAADLPPGAFRC